MANYKDKLEKILISFENKNFLSSILEEIDNAKEYFEKNSNGIFLYGPLALDLQPILEEKYPHVKIKTGEHRENGKGFYHINANLDQLSIITNYKHLI